MESSHKAETIKKEVMCERFGKPLGTGECPRCNGLKLEREKGVYLAA